VESGSEPTLFTSCFLGWEEKSSEAYVDPYEAKLAALREEKAKHVIAAAPAGPRGTVQTHAHPLRWALATCTRCWTSTRMGVL
jgi:hypothetical protein